MRILAKKRRIPDTLKQIKDDLKIGQELKVKKKDEENTRIFSQQDFVVTKKYNNIFYAKNKRTGFVECFKYSDLLVKDEVEISMGGVNNDRLR